jgi:hypothetical protein
MITIGKRAVPSRAYVAAFDFKAPQQKKVGALSGGAWFAGGRQCDRLGESSDDRASVPHGVWI